MKLRHRHYRALQELSTNCIIAGRTFFFLNVPSDMEFPEGFPKGVRLLDGHSKYQINKQKSFRRRLDSKKVLQWLYENGKSEYSPEMLRKEIHIVEMRVAGLMNGLLLINGPKQESEWRKNE